MQLIFSRFSCGFETVLSAKTEKNYVRHSDNFFLTKYGILTNYNFDIFTHISYNFWLTQTYYTSFSSSEIVELMISLTKSSSSYGFWATVQNISLIFSVQTLRDSFSVFHCIWKQSFFRFLDNICGSNATHGLSTHW